MITQFFINLGTTVAGWFVSLFPPFDVPTWFTNLDSQVNVVLDAVGGLAVWAPWPLVIAVTLVCLTTWFMCLIVKYGRAIASYIPFFGGAG